MEALAQNLLTYETLPEVIEDVEQLEYVLSTPTAALIQDLARLEGDILILGVGGKVGPTLARLAKRAAPNKRVVGVARFSDPDVRTRLESWGVETITCDLLDRTAVAKLPELPNVIYMAGRKFGTTGDESFTWAMNVYLPGIIAERFINSRIVAFSTLCVYPFADIRHQGWDETQPPGPYGEYANSCVGRERMFEYFSKLHDMPGRVIRLNYAIDMRYGVLNEVASKVFAGEAVDLTTGHVNVVWQGDSSSQIIRALLHCTTPTTPLNVGGPEVTSIRAVAEQFGVIFGKAPQFVGEESPKSWINNTNQAIGLFGHPVVPLGRMVDWTAHWVAKGGELHNKPTRYDEQQGKF